MNTNSVPDDVFDRVPILNYVPPHYRGWVIVAAWVIPYAARYAHAFANGRGVFGSAHAVLFGTNTPSAPKTTPAAQG